MLVGPHHTAQDPPLLTHALLTVHALHNVQQLFDGLFGCMNPTGSCRESLLSSAKQD